VGDGVPLVFQVAGALVLGGALGEQADRRAEQPFGGSQALPCEGRIPLGLERARRGQGAGPPDWRVGAALQGGGRRQVLPSDFVRFRLVTLVVRADVEDADQRVVAAAPDDRVREVVDVPQVGDRIDGVAEHAGGRLQRLAGIFVPAGVLRADLLVNADQGPAVPCEPVAVELFLPLGVLGGWAALRRDRSPLDRRPVSW
jgi:hypothetical protein